MGERVFMPGANTELTGYLAVRSRPEPGVLVLHAWLGLNDCIQRGAERLEGVLVLAPDV